MVKVCEWNKGNELTAYGTDIKACKAKCIERSIDIVRCTEGEPVKILMATAKVRPISKNIHVDVHYKIRNSDHMSFSRFLWR